MLLYTFNKSYIKHCVTSVYELHHSYDLSIGMFVIIHVIISYQAILITIIFIYFYSRFGYL